MALAGIFRVIGLTAGFPFFGAGTATWYTEGSFGSAEVVACKRRGFRPVFPLLSLIRLTSCCANLVLVCTVGGEDEDEREDALQLRADSTAADGDSDCGRRLLGTARGVDA